MQPTLPLLRSLTSASCRQHVAVARRALTVCAASLTTLRTTASLVPASTLHHISNTSLSNQHPLLSSQPHRCQSRMPNKNDKKNMKAKKVDKQAKTVAKVTGKSDKQKRKGGGGVSLGDNADGEDLTQQVKLTEMEQKMDSYIAKFTEAMSGMRIGRAAPTALDNVQVPAYGSNQPLKSLAQVSLRGGQTLVISAFDTATVKDIDRAIRQSGMELNPQTEGDNKLIVSFPKPTREVRDNLLKQLGKKEEETRIQIRNCRVEALQRLKQKSAGANSSFTEDDVQWLKEEIQNVTDSKLGEVDILIQAKEKELEEV